jgi:hypothetical protein
LAAVLAKSKGINVFHSAAAPCCWLLCFKCLQV